MPQVEVTFDIDANGIVSVSAKDKGTGKEQQIRIQASGGLSDADIEKMVKEAEQFATEDKKRREVAEARNQAESLIHTTERSVSEAGDKVSADLKGSIETAITDLRRALEGEDASDIQAKTQALGQLSMKLGEEIYKQEQPAAGAGAAEGGAAGGQQDEGVVDAEFSEVDDNKK